MGASAACDRCLARCVRTVHLDNSFGLRTILSTNGFVD